MSNQLMQSNPTSYNVQKKKNVCCTRRPMYHVKTTVFNTWRTGSERHDIVGQAFSTICMWDKWSGQVATQLKDSELEVSLLQPDSVFKQGKDKKKKKKKFTRTLFQGQLYWHFSLSISIQNLLEIKNKENICFCLKEIFISRYSDQVSLNTKTSARNCFMAMTNLQAGRQAGKVFTQDWCHCAW